MRAPLLSRRPVETPRDATPSPYAAAQEDVVQLVQKLLASGSGAASPADIVRSHFAGRVELGDEQVAALLRAELTVDGHDHRRRPAGR